MHDTLLPLFNGGGKLCVEPHSAHLEGKNQPMQVYDQPMDHHVHDVNVDDVVDQGRRETTNYRGMPKCLVQIVCDTNFTTPLSSHTLYGSQHALFAHDCYASFVSNMCYEEEFVSFDESQNSKN